MKEQEQFPSGGSGEGGEPKEMDVSDLPNKEFKEMVVRMLNTLEC